jgi:hypothetical protein
LGRREIPGYMHNSEMEKYFMENDKYHIEKKKKVKSQDQLQV